MYRSFRSFTLFTALFALLIALPGCYKASVGGLQPNGSPGNERVLYAHTLIAGLIPLNEVDVSRTCGAKGVWSVSSRMNLVTMIASSFTGGLYVPMAVRVTCVD
jgi:hypothetical protein